MIKENAHHKGEMGQRVAVVVVAYNEERFIGSFLDSMQKTIFKDYQILVVNNGSKDRTGEIVQGFRGVRLIYNKRNLGYAGGNNVGIRQALKASFQFILIINPDMKMDPAWLSELMKVAETYPHFDVLAPLQYTYDGKEIDPVFMRILNQNSDFREDWKEKRPLREIYEVPDTFGAAMCIKREVFLKVGLFDPYYFIYCEEIDFFQRAELKGIRVGVVTTSKVYHWHGLLHSKSMPFYLKYLQIRNGFLVILKDPRYPFTTNVVRWWQKFIHALGKKENFWVGLRNKTFLVLIQFRLLIALPIILRKRSQERKKACYL